MFERYTEKARRVIFFARYEASQFGSPCIETEHLLLGFKKALDHLDAGRYDALVVGNPGRRVGWMSEYGHRLHFGDDGIAVCPESGERYRLTEAGTVVKLEN